MILHRIATQADIPALVELIESAYRGDRSRAGWTTEANLIGGQRIDAAMLAAMLATPGQALLVFERDCAMLACANIENRNTYGYIGLVSVQPQQQAQGLGRHVLAMSEAYCRDTWQLLRVRMTVIPLRTELMAWYGRRGYTDTGETAAFPYGEPQFGVPVRDDLYFAVLEKQLA
jgi:GNAT superfamily N-acetyltransferase